MGCQRREVHIETITREDRQAARGQHLSQRVDELVGHVLGAGTQLEDGQKLGAGINRQPEPLHLCMAAQAGAEFVQLHVREVEVAEGAFLQALRMQARTCQPPRDGGLTAAKDSLRG